MESQRPYSPPVSPARRASDAASFDKLPPELLFDVLQRLPAKDFCRLRAVCRSWGSLLTSDAAFLMAHAQRYKEPLFLAKFRDDDTHVYVVDLSGSVVKRIAGAEGGLQVMRTRQNNVACLASERNTCRVLNPATGGIHHVLPPVPTNRLILSNHYTVFSLGLVTSTGEYKLLHQWWYRPFNPRGSGLQVLTINRGTDRAQQWRPRPGPPHSIDVCSDVVLDGVVYFLTSPDYILPQDPPISSMAPNHVRVIPRVPGDYIVSFDLAREEWRRDLHGPSSTGNLTSGKMTRHELTLADLNGSLVLAHHPRSLSIMDLWFLLDFESMLWMKQYGIRTEPVDASLPPRFRYRLIPLLVLDDGTLVIHLAPTGSLLICDPGTNSFTTVDMRHELESVAVYPGSLLSQQDANMLV